MNYLIKDTTKEERKSIAKKAFGISIAANERPSNEVVEIVKKYINGEIELEEVQKQVDEKDYPEPEHLERIIKMSIEKGINKKIDSLNQIVER